MEQLTIDIPATLEQVMATNNYIIAKTHAEAYVEAGKRLTTASGPIVPKKLFFDQETKKIVYVYYRLKNKEHRLFVIF